MRISYGIKRWPRRGTPPVRSDFRGAFAVGVVGATPEWIAGVLSRSRGAQGHGGTALRTARDGDGPTGRLRRTGRISLGAAAFAFGEAGGGQLLGVAAVFDEGALESADLLVEEVVGLVNEAEGGIGPDRRVFVVQPAGVERAALRIGEIGRQA